MTRLKDWREVINQDFPSVGPITDKTVRVIQECASSGRYGRYSAREAMGKIWTDRDYEERRRRVLATPLP